MRQGIKWIAAIVMGAGSLGATVYRVTVSRDVGFPGTLSWALARAGSGDTIVLEVDVDAVDNQYTVSQGQLLILGQGHVVLGDPSNTAFTIMANGVQVIGLSIENFYKGVEVWADSVLLKNLKINAAGGIGVWFDGARWSRAESLSVTSNGNVGVYLRNSYGVVISASEIYGNKTGVHLLYSKACTLRALTVRDNNTTIGSWGLIVYSSDSNLIENLTAYNNGVLNAEGGVKFDQAKYNLLSGGRIYSNGVGVYLYDADSNILRDFSADSNWRGVFVDLSSSGNHLLGLSLTGNSDCGLYLGRFSSGNVVEKIDASANGVGVKVDNVTGNLLTGVMIHNNTFAGVVLTGGCAQNIIEGSWIYSNGQSGILINADAEGNQVLNTTVYLNRAHGIYIDGAKNNLIQECTIYRNYKDGVSITNAASVGNRITRCSFWDNRELAIDLGDDGVTVSDASYNTDIPNRGIDYPELKESQVVIPGDSIIVRGFVGPAFAGATVEVYAADPDPTGYGEGKRYLASGTVFPDGTFEIVTGGINPPLQQTDSLTALIIDADGNTSEFSGQLDPQYQDAEEVAGWPLLEVRPTGKALLVRAGSRASLTLRVYSPSGALVYSERLTLTPGLNRVPVPLPSGAYVAILGPARVNFVVLR